MHWACEELIGKTYTKEYTSMQCTKTVDTRFHACKSNYRYVDLRECSSVSLSLLYMYQDNLTDLKGTLSSSRSIHRLYRNLSTQSQSNKEKMNRLDWQAPHTQLY